MPVVLLSHLIMIKKVLTGYRIESHKVAANPGQVEDIRNYFQIAGFKRM